MRNGLDGKIRNGKEKKLINACIVLLIVIFPVLAAIFFFFRAFFGFGIRRDQSDRQVEI